MATVSIITATYNRSEVLRWAIESARCQTFDDWQMVVVGDACTDDTAEVVASFSDPRIRFVNRATNFGEQSGPNNDGFRLTSGRFIAYLNHDDLWFPDHLASLVDFIQRTGADLVYAVPLAVDVHGAFYCGWTNEELRYAPTHFVPASLWLARRELIDELGGWRAARAIHARNPSQDLLYRAWRRTKDLRCHPRVSALILPSGGRPGSYRTRDDRQHRALAERMRQPGFREQCATLLALRYARDLHASRRGWRASAHDALDRALVAFGLSPDAVRNAVARRPRGWWIDHLRELRGLPGLDTRDRR